jgi:CRP-like cAMP-binding protein
VTKKNLIIQCECGKQVKRGYLRYHEESIWHQQYLTAISLRQRGLTFAEIGRQLGMTRAYVSQMFARLETETAA